MSKETAQLHRQSLLIVLGSVFGVIVLIGVVVLVGYARFLNHYSNQMYPGVFLAGQDVGGLTYLDAWDVLEDAATEVRTGITVSYSPGRGRRTEPTDSGYFTTD